MRRTNGHSNGGDSHPLQPCADKRALRGSKTHVNGEAMAGR